MSHISVTCPNEECEHEIQLQVSITPGERAIWGLPENSYPGSDPVAELNEEEPTKCPKCGPWTAEQREEFGEKITEALDSFDFSSLNEYNGPDTLEEYYGDR